MFTGIIEEMGEVRQLSRRPQGYCLGVQARGIGAGVRVGESVAVNGACLTVTQVRGDQLEFDLLPETRTTTTLGSLAAGEKVNLERSLQMGGRISGHFVTGHVDCQGVIRGKARQEGNLCFRIAVPPQMMRYVAAKGSIAVDGISLTVMRAQSGLVGVYIIPHTAAQTTLGFKGPGARVNVEFDILAKYCQGR